MLEHIRRLEHLTDVGRITTPLSTHSVSSEAGKWYSGMQRGR